MKKIKNIELTRNSKKQLNFYKNFYEYIDNIHLNKHEVAKYFPVFNTRQNVSRFIETYEYWKLIQNVPGSIIECGAGSGQFMMAMAHFSSIFEPHHYTRKIIGFDTFEGFPEINLKDKTSKAHHMKKGGLNFSSYSYLKKIKEFYDQNRMIGNINKIDFVKGDISITLKKYLKDNPALVVALLHLDLDLYKPTKDSIKMLLELMPKGSVIVFDEINHSDYPGETIAIKEVLGLNNLRLKRTFPASMAAYCVIE